MRTDAARVLEVDEPDDLTRARALAPLLDVPGPGSLPTRRDVDAIVLDFDGTQTDDRVYIDAEGRELVAVHRGDGLGIAALRRAELKLLILSSEKNPVVAARARKLHLPVLHGVDRKDIALKQWCEEEGIAPERVLYVGNDVNDLPCFGLVGWPVAVMRRPRDRAGRGACGDVHPRRRRSDPRDRLVDPRSLPVARSLPGEGLESKEQICMSSTQRFRTFGDRVVGPGLPVYVTGEIGINHNGDLDNALALVDAAVEAGCDAVKFQKRTPEICTPATSGTSSATPPGAG